MSVSLADSSRTRILAISLSLLEVVFLSEPLMMIRNRPFTLMEIPFEHTFGGLLLAKSSVPFKDRTVSLNVSRLL